MTPLMTERLVLRTFHPADADDLFEYLSDEEVVRFEPYGVFTHEMCISEARKRSSDPAFFAVCLKDTGKLAGNLYFEALGDGVHELGFVFSRAFQGMGYAWESSRKLMYYGFKSLGIRRVVARCNPENIRSWRLLERLGMRREGHLIQNASFKTDAMGFPIWQDTYEYAILSSEFH